MDNPLEETAPRGNGAGGLAGPPHANNQLHTCPRVQHPDAKVEEIYQRLRQLYQGEFALFLIEVAGPLWTALTRRKPGKAPLSPGWQNLPAQRRTEKCDIDALLRGLADFVVTGRRLGTKLPKRTPVPGNIGMVVPEGLIVADFDTEQGFQRGQAKCPENPAQLSSRGGHILMRLPDGARIRNWTAVVLEPDLVCDVRVAGGQIVVEPSVHVSGKAYRWLKPLPPRIEDVPLAPPDWIEAIRALGLHKVSKHSVFSSSCTDADQEVHGQEVQNSTKANEVHVVHEVQAEQDEKRRACNGYAQVRGKALTFSVDVNAKIDSSIQASLPTAPSKRNDSVFTLARHLLSIPEVKAAAKTSLITLRDLVLRHYRAIPPGLAKDDEAQHWADFVYAWPRVRHPFGATFQNAVERARSNPSEVAMAACTDTGMTNGLMRLLAALCFELHQEWRGNPFFLSGPKAAKVLECDDKQAYRYLEAFCAVGILGLVAKGQARPGGDASIYRWLWGCDLADGS